MKMAFSDASEITPGQGRAKLPVMRSGLLYTGDAQAGFEMSTSLHLWGRNLHGQANCRDDKLVALPSQLLPEVVDASLGTNHAAAVTVEGHLYAWGSNEHGQVGTGSKKAIGKPTLVMEGVRSVCLAGDSSAAITDDGQLFMWGFNESGQLGVGNKSDVLSPTKVMDEVKSVWMSEDVTFAITFTGELFAWGSNRWGRLGNGSNIDAVKPVLVMRGVRSAKVDAFQALALGSNGVLSQWGCLYCAGGSMRKTTRPAEVLSNVVAFDMGLLSTAALTRDDKLWTWGSSGYGQLGRSGDISQPEVVLENVAAFSLGDYHAGAITHDAALFMWGLNDHGQLGDGSFANHDKPFKLMEDVAQVQLGQRASMAISRNGQLLAWGWNYFGELGVQGLTTIEAEASDVSKPTPVLDSAARVMFSQGSFAAALCMQSDGVELSGDLRATLPGSYVLQATPRAGFAWEDGTRATKELSWSIEPASIASASFAEISMQPYTAQPATPPVLADFAGLRLVEGQDYELNYLDNVEQGWATARVTGRGHFSGVADIPFEVTSVKPIRRFLGKNRALDGTLAQVALEVFPQGCDEVVITRADLPEEPLCAMGLAGALGGAVLVSEGAALTAATIEALKKLSPKRVTLIGGSVALSQTLEDELGSMVGSDNVRRLMGANSTETSLEVARACIAAGGSVDKVIVSRPRNAGSSVALAAFAYAHKIPFLATNICDTTDKLCLTPESAEFLKPGGVLENAHVYLSSTPSVIPDHVMAGIREQGGFTRLAGQSSCDASNVVARYVMEAGLASADTVVVGGCTRASFAMESIAAGLLAGVRGGVMLLANDSEEDKGGLEAIVDGDSKGGRAFLAEFANSIKEASVVGDVHLISSKLQRRIAGIVSGE